MVKVTYRKFKFYRAVKIGLESTKSKHYTKFVLENNRLRLFICQQKCGTCNLCLTEKYHIITLKQKLRNKKSELISMCQHVISILLKNFKEIPSTVCIANRDNILICQVAQLEIFRTCGSIPHTCKHLI